MKKILFIAAAMMMSIAETASAAAGLFRILPDAVCKDYNHVGSHWLSSFQVNGQDVFQGNYTIELNAGDQLVLDTRMTEQDQYPDVGEASTTYTVTKNDLKNGFTVPQTIRVTEDRGRYKGCSCTWNVSYEFRPEEK